MTKARRSSIFTLAFFHSFARLVGWRGAATMTTARHRRPYRDTSSSTCRSWCSSLGTPSYVESQASSHTFTQGLWRRADYGGGANVDLIYFAVAAAAGAQEGSDLDLTVEECNCWE
jgi:hypothetical protein